MIHLILKIVGVVLLVLLVCVANSRYKDLPEVGAVILKMLGAAIICLWWGFRMFSRTGFILTIVVNFFAAVLLVNDMESEGPSIFSHEYMEKMEDKWKDEDEEFEFEWKLEQEERCNQKNNFYY